jgi:hypothetical protein
LTNNSICGIRLSREPAIGKNWHNAILPDKQEQITGSATIKKMPIQVTVTINLKFKT